VRVLAFDEARLGLKTWFRRRWCARGSRPPWVFQDQYEWGWLYLAVEPTTGQSVCLYLPRLDGCCLEIFLQTLRHAYPQEEIILVMDQAGSHRNGTVHWPAGIYPLLLPPYSPELNPAERRFEALRAVRANTIFDTLEALIGALTEALRPYWQEVSASARLAGYPWWLEGVANIRTSD
jgi:transposase